MFQFNAYSAPLFVGFLQGVVYAVLLFRRGYREERRSDHWLAWLLLLGCIYIMQYMLGFGGWYDSHDWRSTFMFYFPFYLLLFVGPVMYFYFRSLANHEFRLRWQDGWHFAPGAATLAIYLVIFLHDVGWKHWLQSTDLPLHYGTQGLWSNWRQDHLPLIPFGLISTFIYAVLTIRVYNRYRRYLVDNFSTTEELSFGWLRLLLYAIILALAVNWGVQIIALAADMSYRQFWTSHLAFAVMIYVLAIQGYAAVPHTTRPPAFEPERVQLETTPPAMTEPDDEVQKWKTKLEQYVAKEKPFLEPQLTLSDLAQRLRTNTSVLSKVINAGFGQNFNDFINQLRVQAVQEKLQQGEAERLTLMSIALDCGFNSKATFNRAFRKHAGLSPREYLERQGPK